MTAGTRSPRVPGHALAPDRLGSRVVVSALLVLVVVGLDIHFGGPLNRLDHRLADRMSRWDLRARPWPRRGLTIGVWFGQRGIVITGSVLIMVALAWRSRTVEPILRLAVALVVLVLFVYAGKLGLARNAPIQDVRGVPSGRGGSFPSGHAANAVALWGLADWSVRYWPAPPALRMAVRAGRWVAPVAVTVAMTLLNYHWLTDFIGGVAVGVATLAAARRPAWSRVATTIGTRWARIRLKDD